jgi:hypothetical protein
LRDSLCYVRGFPSPGGNSGRRSLGEALEAGQGERRAAFLAGGPCSLPPGLSLAPEGKGALEGARLYLYSKPIWKNLNWFVFEQVAYFNVSSGKGDELFAGISNKK